MKLLGVGKDIPVIGSLNEAPHADTLLIGIAPSGGKLPTEMRKIVLEAISRKMTIIAGLHEFLSDDLEISQAAAHSGSRIVDLRRSDYSAVSQRKGFREECMRILTVGQDCGVGKMVTSIEICRGLKQVGSDAKFVATGQTGILIEGDGCPIDAVVSDFINGAAENLVMINQNHEFLSIEGQGSVLHPRYSAVTLGLLHGSMPQGLVLCAEAGRKTVSGMDHISLPSLEKLKKLYESLADWDSFQGVIGISLNCRNVSQEEAQKQKGELSDTFGLPVCDVIIDGPELLVKAVLKMKATSCSN